MRIKRLKATFTAVFCFACVLSGFPDLGNTSAAETVVTNDFELNYEGWYATGDMTRLKAVDGVGYHNSRCMLVSNRQAPEDSAMSEKGFYLDGGIKYSYSAWVKSEGDEKFYLSLRWLNTDTGVYEVKTLDKKTASSGEWIELAAEFSAPKGSVNLTLMLNTDSTNDFCFDAVTVTQKSNDVYATASDKGLKDVFADYFKVGTCVPSSLIANSTATAIILKDFNSITCENEMKPDYTLVKSQCSGTEIGVSLDKAASILDFCVKNNIAVRGHTLVWHSQTPEWFFKEDFNADNDYVSSTVMDKRMESYIKNIFATIKEQYPDLDLYAYDVCNECISDDSDRTANYGGAREAGYGDGKSPWVQVYGDNSFVEKAYTYARKYAPTGCKLFYNDYNEYWGHKRDSIYTMCKSLYDKGLLDGIGMQSHIMADGATGFTGINNYTTALKKYADIGCEVQITELDVDITDSSNTYTDTEQAEKYKAVMQAAVDLNNGTSNGKVTAFCVWGIDDGHSWVNSGDNIGSNPLLYDSDFNPKTAYNTLMTMLDEDSSNTDSNTSQYDWYFDSTFEGNTDSWTGRGAASVAISGDESCIGNKALAVTGRTATWNGTQKALDTAIYKTGEEYSFSVNVMYNAGSDTEPFYLKLQYVDAEGETHYSTVAEAVVTKGEWVRLYNENYQIPNDATNLYLYVETGNTTCDFYIDEAVAAVGGTSIKPLILGDVNADGTINAIDLAIVKSSVSGDGFVSNVARLAADVDQSGSVDDTDIEQIKQFLLAEITEFNLTRKSPAS